MNFFDVLFWMGVMCLLPIGIAIVRDGLREAELSREPSAKIPDLLTIR